MLLASSLFALQLCVGLDLLHGFRGAVVSPTLNPQPEGPRITLLMAPTL
jgi:hypothetical protein